MSVFRIWNIENAGLDVCPGAQTDGLIAQCKKTHQSTT